MIIKRSEAIIIVSFIKYFELSEDDRLEIIDSAIAEKSLDNFSEDQANQLGRKYIEFGLKTVTNNYLASAITDHLGYRVSVTGKEAKLFECFCCGYKTLTLRGEYDICQVCWWEDDGGNILEKYSSVNHMTLIEGKANFAEAGIIDPNLLDKADKERFEKYMK